LSLFLDAFSIVAIVAGAVFFLAGTVGLLRFPDAYTRLHALTKADNLGLGAGGHRAAAADGRACSAAQAGAGVAAGAAVGRGGVAADRALRRHGSDPAP
jgi:multisubunit Na+/H+ antiporter MnhG subunit